MGLTVENLSTYAKFLNGQSAILENISFSLAMGEKLAIVGESGSGKTMTALAILGLLPENCTFSGQITLDGISLSSLSQKKLSTLRGREIVYIPQSGLEYLNPSLKIKAQLIEQLKLCGVKENLSEYARNLLMQAELEDAVTIMEKYPFELSGGQAQRVMLALALASKPKLVIADEPMSGVDEQTALLLLNKLFTAFDSACLVVITHNVSYAKTCDKIMVLKGGVVQEIGNTCEIIAGPKSDYTKLLLKDAAFSGDR